MSVLSHITRDGWLQKCIAAIMAVVMLLWPLDGCASAEVSAIGRRSAAAAAMADGRSASAAAAADEPSAESADNGSVASRAAAALPDTISLGAPLTRPAEVVEEEITAADGRIDVTAVDTVAVDLNMQRLALDDNADDDALDTRNLSVDSIMALHDAQVLETKPKEEPADEWVPREVEFSPDPTRAVWMAALFPGLGQIYNRRYWKLPIVVGGYLGLAYATNWNNTMLHDYTIAYSDLLDNDPDTRSYMNLFSPNVKEENIDKGWLQGVIRSRRNYFRRNRDLCIISMVGVYLLAMVDAYVDASLSHFDISPDLTMDLAPALIQDGRQRLPSLGLMWALNF